jgi:hypothetical protein
MIGCTLSVPNDLAILIYIKHYDTRQYESILADGSAKFHFRNIRRLMFFLSGLRVVRLKDSSRLIKNLINLLQSLFNTQVVDIL